MNAISNVAKIFLAAGVIGLALAGCERRTDDAATGSSGTSGQPYGQSNSGTGTSGAGTSSGTSQSGTGSAGQYDKAPPPAGTGSSK